MVDVELMDLEIVLEAGYPAWRGHLVADGMPICRMAGSPDELVVLSWFRDRGPDDLDALAEAITSDGLTRIDASGRPRPDTLIERCADIVATAIAEKGIREVMANAILFTVRKGVAGETMLLSVSIPADGTPSGATAHVKAHHPDAVVLNEMPMDKAIEAYLAALDVTEPA